MIYTIRDAKEPNDIIPNGLVQLVADGQATNVFQADENAQFEFLMDCGGSLVNEVAAEPTGQSTCDFSFNTDQFDSNAAVSYVTAYVEMPPNVQFSQAGELYVGGSLAMQDTTIWESHGVISSCVARGLIFFELSAGQDTEIVSAPWIWIYNPGQADELTISGTDATVTGSTFWHIYCTNFNTGEVYPVNLITDDSSNSCY